MKILITGGCGFLGSNIASYLSEKNDEIFIFDNLSKLGGAENLSWLQSKNKIKFLHGDIRIKDSVEEAVKLANPEIVFHFAGQVAMTRSILFPREDFEINAVGTLNLLEAIKAHSPNALAIYSSTNKVYGDLEQYQYSELSDRYVCNNYQFGFNEGTPLNFSSPYGCSKGAADQYFLDYHRIYGLKTIVFRHSSMYGGRQFFNSDQGWIGWFCQQAVEQLKNPHHSFKISGNGKQVRDLLHANDMQKLYHSVSLNPDPCIGKAYNIGGGAKNALSIRELFNLLNTKLNIELKYLKNEQRPSDQKVFIADITSITNDSGWKPKVDYSYGIDQMLQWIKEKNFIESKQ
jgi:CDP-paratose 2-epimerase